MSSATVDSSSMSFDPYATSFVDASQLQTYPDFYPVSVFDTEFEDFGSDFTSDSAPSPRSPLSPALSASSLGFSTTEPWTFWDAAGFSAEPDSSLFGCQTFAASSPPSNASLSPAINPIDLSVSASMDSKPLFFQSPTMPNQQKALPTSPEAAGAKRYPSRAVKRKSASGPTADEPASKTAAVSPKTSSKSSKDSAAHAPKKSAHNMIEKRYRTNLNDKIAQLRDAVPSLRQMAQRAKAAEAGGAVEFEDAAEDDLLEAAGLGQGAKLNKATILSKATEYILQLERRNQGLETENSALRGRMEGLEMMMMSGRGDVAGGWN